MNTDSQNASVLVKTQRKTYGPRSIKGYGSGAMITATVRYDDECGNGHNTFSITAEVVTPASKRRNDLEAGGCMHEDIARVFPEIAPFIKWHLTSPDGPMHYLANTIYQAGERDCHGLLRGEFHPHLSRGPRQANGVEGVPCWGLCKVPDVGQDCAGLVYSATKPGPITLEWRPYGRTGEGKARELDNARASAVWPEATDEELTAPGLEERLKARLPALMAEFRAAVESLGFTY